MDWREEYQVQIAEHNTPLGWVTRIRVKRHDGKDGITWDVLQRIKDEVAGPEATAIEFYPAESELVDELNMRHLWVIQSEWLPFGLGRRNQ